MNGTALSQTKNSHKLSAHVQKAVLWNRNNLLRFRFRFWLWKSFGAGSGSSSSSRQYFSTVSKKKNLHKILPFQYQKQLNFQKVGLSVFDFLTFFITFYVESGSKSGFGTGSGSGTETVIDSGSGSGKAKSYGTFGSGSTTLIESNFLLQTFQFWFF